MKLDLTLRKANSFGETYGARKFYAMKMQNGLKELKQGTVEARQKDIVIKAEMVTARSKKIPNWKAPGSDGVQGY